MGRSGRRTVSITTILLLSIFLSFCFLSVAECRADSTSKKLRRVTFYTEPPGADVKISFDNGVTRIPLGKSGSPLILDPAQAGSARSCLIFFEKVNFDQQPKQVEVEYFLTHSRFPEKGALQLVSSYRKVMFFSEPPGAGVYMDMYSNPQSAIFLCRTGEEFQLNTYALAEGKEYTLYFRLPHFKEWNGTLSKQSLKPGVLNFYPPGKTPVRLTPDIPVIIPLYHWVKTHILASLVILCFTIPLCAWLVFGLILPRVNKSRQEKARVDYWETLAAKVNRDDPLFGRRVGPYRILSKLGEGGMAAVYKAVPETTFSEEEAVAIKVMHSNLVQTPEYVKRFKREIQITKDLNHPNILKVLDFGDNEGMLYITMEFIRGKTLKDKIPEKGFPIDVFLEIFGKILDAMIYAHSHKILHRDLKPDNVMITENNRVIIMDFGLARGHDQSAITAAGSAFGTPAYMAPEQISEARADERSDQYQLGVVAYQMLSGDVPFYDEVTANIMFQVLTENPRPIRERRAAIPLGLERVVLKMLEKDPGDRFPSLADVRKAMDRVAEILKEINPA